MNVTVSLFSKMNSMSACPLSRTAPISTNLKAPYKHQPLRHEKRDSLQARHWHKVTKFPVSDGTSKLFDMKLPVLRKDYNMRKQDKKFI